MQGKTCFNFKSDDEKLSKQLEQLTKVGIENFKKTGYNG
jgi:hypothetical protein